MADHIKPSRANKMGTLKSTLLPIASNSIAFDKIYLVIALATAATVTMLLLTGTDQTFATIVAFYITFVQCAVIYYLCGRRELWPSMIGVFAISCLAFLMTNVFGAMAGTFRPPWVMALINDASIGSRFVGHFVGAGALEELYKALPLLALAILGLVCRSGPPHLRAISLTEPLDGIALGVASGAAFALLETIYQYYPQAITNTMTALKDHPDSVRQLAGLLYGLEVLVIRAISQIGGHMAWSGYLGYFIGLAVLRPKAAPLYLVVGYVTASMLHGAWNAAAGSQQLLGLVVAFISIAFLIAAILKARRMSPTRSQNFATKAFSVAGIAPVVSPVPPAARAERAAPLANVAPPRREVMPEKVAPRAAGAFVLKIGPVECVAAPGVKIEPRMLGAAGAGRGRAPIAEVVGDATGLGLKNLGEKAWHVTSPEGRKVEVGYGQVAPLAKGTIIDFVGIECVVTTG
ncbi:PrsW family intramembrane metalloprotease [Chelatococcus asaccharovorans]|uniref:RsiW-degrading membrane proteinase PrsW (M82 family) n=1 Tax=Chelatococcus asaccharovorans TaxID=28210 RepID=A0A2V3TYA1_9HYPH|nr:PrsW family intramembrane metalloprotease [Chelatococcus asaccharovorans]MBS7704647.1 PrsW family intramembrane metalloprotease [Chelatococcus asaccharovorans]PXW54548.1 RsiW-degrading membrane proteinase PrsW (M82 family) [Chelatococcus asaccharovorans]